MFSAFKMKWKKKHYGVTTTTDGGAGGGSSFPFGDLPMELQVECLKWLGPPGPDWLHCCLANRLTCQLCHDPTLWHHFCDLRGIRMPEEEEEEEKEEGGGGEKEEEPAGESWKNLYLSNCSCFGAFFLYFLYYYCFKLFFCLVAKVNHLVLFGDNKEGSLSLSANQRTVTQHSSSNGHCKCRSANQWTSGKHYFEVTIDKTHQQIFIGILPVSKATSSNSIVGHSSDPGWSVIPYTCYLLGNYGKQRVPPEGLARDTRFENGDVIGIYLDVDAGHLFYFRNKKYFVGLKGCDDIRQQQPYYAAVSLLLNEEQVTFSFPAVIPEFVRSHVKGLH
ncbi:negative regulation of SNARE complex assembly [Balamuthia mandrillaris]